MRRSVLILLAIILVIALSSSVTAMRQTDQHNESVVVESPRFELIVYQVQDPYLGTVTSPAERDPAVRYIGVEVAVANDSDAPLTTGRSYLRLRDTDGRDHLAAAVFGTEAALQNRVIISGEAARGWVWYAIPTDVEISQIYLVATALELVLPWGEAPIGTPIIATPSASPALVNR